MNTTKHQSFPISKKVGIIAGPALFFMILLSPSPTTLSYEAKVVLAIAAWMIVW
jgi:sodium-dependent dicarboxylate transporter 2/3/5